MTRGPRSILGAAFVALCVQLAGCAPEPKTWSHAQVAVLRSLSLDSLPPLPESHSNRVADDERAIVLGRMLFFDARLSSGGDISCGTCHDPQLHFTDGRSVGRGVNDVTRNTPTLVGGAWQTWFYWDGRRDSLWAQALIPIEAPDEMAGSRARTVRLVASDAEYRRRYVELFGQMPTLVQDTALPAHAGQFTNAAGKDAWMRLPPATRRAVNQVYANVGKAIAAFERTLVPRASPFDRYVEVLVNKGEAAAQSLLDPAAVEGAKLFIDVEATGCLKCHNGPLLTNGGFHNIGSGALDGANPDFGRLLGLQSVLLDEFNCTGPFSDAAAEDCSALRFVARDDHGDMAGAFKVPTLRNVGQTGPYLHDGRFETLEEVIRHYDVPPPEAHELFPLNLSDEQVTNLAAFLRSLSSPPPPAPTT